jgi:hypothetical protein
MEPGRPAAEPAVRASAETDPTQAIQINLSCKPSNALVLGYFLLQLSCIVVQASIAMCRETMRNFTNAARSIGLAATELTRYFGARG